MWTTQPHDPDLHEPQAPIQTGPAMRRQVSLEITDEWCKSCDICVKMCPERCLALNERQIARLVNPEACTGCRVCEWLCPDFAIAVNVEAVPLETIQAESTAEVRA